MKRKLRYKIILKLTKKFCPEIFKFIKKSHEKGNIYIRELVSKQVGKLPRPSTLFALRRKNNMINVIEIGVKEGKNALSIYNVLEPFNLFLVDVWDNKKDYDKTKKKFIEYENVHIIKKSSLDASKDFPDDYFNFIYIDALHNYKSVISDLQFWFPKLQKNGIFAGHDIHNINVKNAVKDFIEIIGSNIDLKIDYPNDWYFVK